MPKRILIVDDEPDVIRLLETRLRKNSYEVISAGCGYEGLYRYLKEKPDLIILDLMLPDLNGYEVCREIRRDISDEDTPIIMLTAKSEDSDRIQGRVIGADVYLTKPFDMDVFLKEIETLLSKER